MYPAKPSSGVPQQSETWESLIQKQQELFEATNSQLENNRVEGQRKYNEANEKINNGGYTEKDLSLHFDFVKNSNRQTSLLIQQFSNETIQSTKELSEKTLKLLHEATKNPNDVPKTTLTPLQNNNLFTQQNLFIQTSPQDINRQPLTWGGKPAQDTNHQPLTWGQLVKVLNEESMSIK